MAARPKKTAKKKTAKKTAPKKTAPKKTTRTKSDFPVDEVRRFLEPGPIVLVSSAHDGERNIMTLGWHMVMGFEPSLVGLYIWDQNHSFELIKKSHQCVINIPTADMAAKIVGIGNTTGGEIDKFEKFKLTAETASMVRAPMIAECHANFECKLVDGSQISNYSLFIFEVVKAHAYETPRVPNMLHYTGDGIFLTGGKSVNYAKRFKPEML
ncbi:flavin reductase [Terrihabitans soli]|uniref:Flavin reductase n=1 Tax=Terrihabitans soli TaxID=708113 RepID=A0A6S6QN92_9HYPH|nr:flavin reductase family protein [Terrihabitans soli]BCJ89387.1 flavin reductase [Terrihabitans soli]